MPKLSSKNKNLSFIPTLQSKDFAGFIKVNAVSSGVPAGWLECDGSAVSRTTYAELFAAIGTDFGVGDGSTTFNLPTIAAPVANTEYIIKAYPDVLGPSVGVENLSLDATFIRNESVRNFTIPSDYSLIVNEYEIATGHTITNLGEMVALDSLDVNGNLDLTNGDLKIADTKPETPSQELFYATGSLTLDGTFTSGIANFTRVGNVVTMTGNAAFTCVSGTTAASTSAIAEIFRPSKYISNVLALEGYLMEVGVNLTGTVYAEFRNYSGSLVAQTSTVAVPSLSYVIV